MKTCHRGLTEKKCLEVITSKDKSRRYPGRLLIIIKPLCVPDESKRLWGIGTYAQVKLVRFVEVTAQL